VILVRHGETDWNVQFRLQGSSDIPLNENGRAQARQAAPVLAELAPVKRIVASDLSRAVETAHIIADAMGAEVVTDARLRERSYGVWEGLLEPERRDQYPEAYAEWASGLEPHVDGYEFNETVRDRAVALIDELAPEDGTHVFVSHGSTTRVLIGALLGLELGSHGVGNLGNAQWAELQQDGDGPWVLRSLNTHSFDGPTVEVRT
jgi:probable phosphoglycerate mutase